MNSEDGKDRGDLESESDDSLRSPGGPARSGFFGRYTFSGVVHNIVNKFSGVVPKTVASPPMTAARDGPTRIRASIEEGGQNRPNEWTPDVSRSTNRNDTRAFSLSVMNQHGVSLELDRADMVREKQPDIRLSSWEGGPPGRPATPGYKRVLPQFRKEASSLTKNVSDIVIHSPSYSSPSYSSPYSGPVGQMPAVRLSPRQRPLLLRNEDRAKPVTVKIAQLDPFIRHRCIENADENNESNINTSVLTETVVDALKKRKRSHLDPDETEMRDPEGSIQLSKKRCSRDEGTSAPETPIVRGLKRPALHDDSGDTNETTDNSPAVTEGATKKFCQNLSPPSLRFGCGARNVIDASYSSHQRWEERLTRAKSLSQSRAASSQDESMPLVEDSGAASSQTSRCSSHFSRMSRADSPTHQSDDYRSGLRSDRAQSTQSSGRSTPLHLLPRLHDSDTGQRATLLFRDGSVKNRVTTMNVSSSSLSVSPFLDLESQLSESNKLKCLVEFTADDLERDRDLLNSRASRLMLGFLDADEEPDEVASVTPSLSTSSIILGQVSTTFQASGTTPVSTTLTVGAKDNRNEVQTGTDSKIDGANVLKSGIDGANVLQSGIDGANVLQSGISSASLSNSTSVLQNPSISSSDQQLAAFGSVGSLLPASASFNFGSSAGLVGSASSPAILSAYGNSTGTVATTLSSSGSQLNPGKSESSLKESSASASTFGTFSAPSSSASDVAKHGSSSSLTGSTISMSSTTIAVGATTTASRSAFGTASNVQTPVVSFGSMSNTKPTTATSSISASLALGGTQATAGSLGNTVTTAFGNSAVVNNSTTAAKGDAQMMPGGFAWGKLSSAQTTAGNLGNAKQLVVTSETTANGLSYGNSGATQTTASSILFGNSGTTQTTANSFSFGNSGATQTTASGLAFGSSNTTQTTATSFSFGNPGATQATANSFPFGKSDNSQTTASSFSFGNSGATQITTGGFAFGTASTNLTTGNVPGSLQTTASAFPFGNSSSSQTVGGGLTFGNSSSAQTTASSFAGLTATPQFSFGKSSTATITGNPSSASGVAFGNLQQPQARGNSLTTANPFGNNIPPANAFGSNLASANVFGSNLTTANAFGGILATANAFGSNLATANALGSTQATSNPFNSGTATANPFGGNTTTANPFGGNTTTANPFGGNMATASPFGMPNNNLDNKPLGLQFNRPDVATTNQSTPQDLRRVLFPGTPANNSTPGSNLPIALPQQQPATAFNFFGSKMDGNTNSSNASGGFVFGKNPTPAPTFGSNPTAGGFTFGKTVGSNLPQPSNQGFSFQGASQSGTNSQIPNTGFSFQGVTQPGTNSQATSNTGFSFNAAPPNFAFGQMPNAPVNGLPSIASFGAGPKFTPGATYGTTTSSRNLRTKKKAR